MKIDLHGKTEQEAIAIILTTLMTFDTNQYDELEIITGNGLVLKNVAIDILDEEGWNWSFNGPNQGSIIVKK